MSTPSTTIYMCAGVPLNNRYDHTLYFTSRSEQQSYFDGKVKNTYHDYTYVRRSWKLKVAASMEAARVWSYLFFRNGTTGKYYYYFINQIEYINENTVELSLELDVLQTYQFEWLLRPCYVEREHSATDEIGENTVDEGLDVGDYITYAKETINLSELSILTAATIDINKFYISNGETEEKIFGSKYDNIFGSFQITATDLSTGWDDLAVLLNYLNTKGKIDTVFTIWLYPTALLTLNSGSYEADIFNKYVGSSKLMTYRTTFETPATIDGYTPKNKKVLQYPYRFLYATNNNGGAAIYQYHQFTGTPTFVIGGNIAPDASIRLTPVAYKGVTANYDESLMMGNYPICSWNNDTYKMWLAQNQNQQNLGLAMSGLKIVGGVAATIGGVAAAGGTGGLGGAVGFAGVTSGVGMITSGATEIASQLAQRADKEIQPPQARGTFSGSHNISRGLQNFDLYHKTIDGYHAKMIDDYFTMYGYACRQVKLPNINARPAFNYVKTIGSNVTGDFCMEDLKLINNIFDKGVTFWKSRDVGNYTLANSP